MSRILFFLTLATLFCYSCNSNSDAESANAAASNRYDIIPLPQSLEEKQGAFTIDKQTQLIYGDKTCQLVVEQFAALIEEAKGWELPVALVEGMDMVKKNAVIFQLEAALSEEEGYELSVDETRVLVKSKTAHGLFYGMQTLRQLLPTDFESKENKAAKKMILPAVEIKDAPRFSYRGLHLDVARHFFPLKTIKAYIDQLAFHKLNYFHWHLTDDQGWRIEIKKYPKLTEISAFRNGTLIGHYNDQPHQFDNKRYGGFYTQEEVREVVAYAKERFITVIPEIEMPGHAQAVLAAYPEFACTQEKFEVLQKWGVSENVFCPTDATFKFLEDVIDEVIELFPGKYIHIGGDECPKVRWKESSFCQQLMKKEGLKDEHELQSYFIQRMEKYINANGKQIIGWDEILEGGLAPNATVMSWRGIEGGIQAAKEKHDVIMTPTTHCYFDYYQSDHPDEPLAIGGFVPLEKIYSFEPIPSELTAEEGKYILGAQANLWTEYIPTAAQLEHMTYPRASALAEVVWSKKSDRNFEDFIERLTSHMKRLEYQGVAAANHLYDLAASIRPENGKVALALSTLSKNSNIHFTIDGSEPSSNGPAYQNKLMIDKDQEVRAQAFLNGEKVGRSWKQSINMHIAAGKDITLSNPPHAKYSGDGDGSIINGVLGANERYGDKEWLGFADGSDFEALIDLEQSQKMKSANFRFFKGEGQWIYLPKSISFSVGNSKEEFKEVATHNQVTGDTKVVQTNLTFPEIEGRFLKIKIQNFGTIPDGAQGAGNKAWLFIDEITVN